MPRSAKGRGIFIFARLRGNPRNHISTAIRSRWRRNYRLSARNTLKRRGYSEMKKTIFAGALGARGDCHVVGTSGAFAGDLTGMSQRHSRGRPPQSILRASSACSSSPRSRRPIGRRWRPRCVRWRAGMPRPSRRPGAPDQPPGGFDRAQRRRHRASGRCGAAVDCSLSDDQKQVALPGPGNGLGPVLAALN